MPRDAALLCQVSACETAATVRCYLWQKPAVTYGRLQDRTSVEQAFTGQPLYQRPTGGLAVQHDDDLTVSVCACHSFIERWGRVPHRLTRRVHAAYTMLVSPVREVLQAFGIATEYGMDLESAERASADCFARSASCDLVEAGTGRKLVGAAMCRKAGAVLLQMSIRPHKAVNVTGDKFVDELRKRYQTR